MHRLSEHFRFRDPVPAYWARTCRFLLKRWPLGRLHHVSVITAAVLLAFTQTILGTSLLAQAKPASATQAPTLQQILERGSTNLVKQGSRGWNPETIRNVEISALVLAVAVIDSDLPKYSSRIVPQGMTLAEFDRMLNREISRRDAWPSVYERLSRGGAGLSIDVLSTERPPVNFIRPTFSYPQGTTGETKQVRLNPTVVAIFDSTLDTIIDNKSGFTYRSDTARAAGLPKRPNGLAYGAAGQSDVADNRLLYAFGSQAAFRPSNPSAQLPAPVNIDNSSVNSQSTYCDLIPKLYEAGRSQEPRDAGVFGLIASRVDTANGFETRDGNFGITGPC